MSVLLKFLFSEENLAKWLRPEWLKLYDPAFVDEELIGKVLDRVREEVVQARDAENTFHPPAAKPVPKQLAQSRSTVSRGRCAT